MDDVFEYEQSILLPSMPPSHISNSLVFDYPVRNGEIAFPQVRKLYHHSHYVSLC